MSSRDRILQTLRQAPRPFEHVPALDTRRDMVPWEHSDPGALQAYFIEQAQALSCVVRVCDGPDVALRHLLAIIGDDRAILSWDAALIPLPGLESALREAGIQVADSDDATVRVGLTGADAALAGTGSLVLVAGPGKPRLVSLLPTVHVAVITASQIVPNLEAWAAAQRAEGLDRFRQASNITLISGPSRTADIGMELVLGAHGPAELHILLLPG